MSWRDYSDWAKRRPAMLRLAESLGRSRGGLRVFDHVCPPPPANLTPNLKNWSTYNLAAVWIGHATVLLRIGGLNILTDPVFSNRVGIGLGLVTGGPRRLIAPAMALRDLPKLDLILVSHAHFDHLDRPTLNRLSKQVPVITSEHNSDLIKDLGFEQVTELRWHESVWLHGLRVTAWPVQHWGARTFHDQHRGFAGFLLEANGVRVLYGADSAIGPHFRTVGRVDLAIMGIGGYDPYVAAHATPEQAWAMAGEIGAEYLLPMHHSTFRLSYEPTSEPMTRLLNVAGRHADRLVGCQIGELWVAPERIGNTSLSLAV